MPRVRLISTALAFIITGAITTATAAQAPAAIVAEPVEQLWIRAERKNADNDVTGQIELAEQVVQMTPDNPRAYLYLAGAQFNANKRAESRATLLRTTQVDPGYAQGWIQLGNSY